MSVYVFDCKCGSSLMLANKVRPVCRACGKQMTISEKVKGSVSYERINSYNRYHGTMTYLAGHGPKDAQ